MRDELKLIERAVNKYNRQQQKRGSGYYRPYGSGVSEQAIREVLLKVDDYKKCQRLNIPLSPSESESESQPNAG